MQPRLELSLRELGHLKVVVGTQFCSSNEVIPYGKVRSGEEPPSVQYILLE